ncbi:MAG TPA: hypothetical protein VK826_08160 [Bacteroidia bacterium]|nr:hypothetical protein [Bacteroidia bacterium]
MIAYELIDHRLIFHLTHDPDTLSDSYDIHFNNIFDFLETRDDDFDPDLMQSIIGVDTYPLENSSDVVIRLDEVEISFKTKESPVSSPVS